MSSSGVVGTIGALWRFPVKSMQGEQLDAADVLDAGIVGDRAYALIDQQTGKVVSAKQPRLWPDLLACRATFPVSPRRGDEIPPARIDLPDGASVMTDALDVDAVLSRFFGRDVQLARAAPVDFTIDQYHPDIENLDPEGHRDEVTETKLGAALFGELGMPSGVPEGSFMDAFPISVITTSTFDHLARLQPGSRFDARRFRMNLVVHTTEPGFVENAWVGRVLQVGDDVQLAVVMPDPRCVMTTLAQPGLPRDAAILKSLATHNRLDVAGVGQYPCAGVYAATASLGVIRMSDALSLL
jgi:uncharacterized protein